MRQLSPFIEDPYSYEPEPIPIIQNPPVVPKDRFGTGLSTLGWTFFLGSLGVSAYRAIPDKFKMLAALTVEEFVSSWKRTLPWLKSIVPEISETITSYKHDPLNPLQPSRISETVLRGNYLKHDVDILQKKLADIESGKLIGDRSSLIEPFLRQYAGGPGFVLSQSETSKFLKGWESLSLEHLLKLRSAGQTSLEKIASEYKWLEPVLGSIESLHKLSTNRDFVKQATKYIQSVDPSFVPNVSSPFESMAAGKGLMIHTGDLDFLKATGQQIEEAIELGKIRFSTTNRFSIGNILESLSNIRIPFLGAQPLKLLYPTELFRQSYPSISKIDKGIEKELRVQGRYDDFIQAGGKIFGIYEEGHARFLSPALGEGYKPVHIRSGVGFGYIARSTDPDDYFVSPAKSFIGPRQPSLIEKAFAELDRYYQMMFGVPTTKFSEFWSSVSENIKKFSESVGIGRQYLSNPESKGIVLGPLSRLSKIADPTQEIQITAPFKTGIAIPYPEGRSYFTKLLERVGLSSGSPTPTKYEELSAIEKLKLALGIEPRRDVLLPESGFRGQIEYRKTKIPVARFGTDQIPDVKDYYQDLKGFAAVKPGQAVLDDLTYKLSRWSWLLQAGAGLGLRPQKSPIHALGQTLGLAGGAYLATQVLGYVNYKIKEFTGVSPVEAGAAGVLYGHYLQLEMQKRLGITSAVKTAEEMFPGIESSELSKAVRATSMALGGAWLGRYFKAPKIGLLSGLLLGGMQATTDFTKDPKEFLDEIEGRRRVEVKRARWWGLGRQPFEGEGTLMTLPHWYQRMRTDYRDIAIYGSAAESWRGSWLPTPENLFLLKNLFDPYYVERRNYMSRPYPVSAPLFHELPFIGPLLSTTLGRVLKPQIEMHKEDYVNTLNTSGSHISTDVDQALGFRPIYGQVFRSDRDIKQRLNISLADTLYKLKELSGLPGFMYEAIADSVGFRLQRKPMMEDAGNITSLARDYYDKNLGGLFGLTELYRRFVPPPNKWMSLNMIPGYNVPDWLPGQRSVFKRDRKSVLDFHTGDPYAKIPMGEARLPGPGYEALNKLHSGKPGVYDPVDRFMILADVAPTSAAFRSYKTIVGGFKRAGLLDDYWTRKYYEGLDIAAKRSEQLPDENERRFTRQNFFESTVLVESVLGSGRFKANGKIYKLAGVETDVEKIIYKNNLPIEAAESLQDTIHELDTRLRSYVGKPVNLKVGMLEDNAYPTVIEGFNREYINRGLWSGSRDPLSTYAKYGNNELASIWESLRHVDLPGPLGWPLNKLWSRYDAIEQYRKREIEGADFAGWNQPIRNFIKPWIRQVIGGLTGNIEPYSDTVAQRELDTYFDRLKYYKYRSLQQHALYAGDMNSAEVLEQMWRKTMIGMSAPDANWLRDAYGAMPNKERKYFDRFKRIQDKQDREKILKMVPEDMKPLYVGVWSSLDPSTNGPMPTSFRERGALRNMRTSQFEVDSQVASYLSQRSIPEDTWVGWAPSIGIDDIKIATLHQTARDIHSAGMYERQLSDIRISRPYILGQYVPEAFKGPSGIDGVMYNKLLNRMTGYNRTLTGINSIVIRKTKNYEMKARLATSNTSGRFN